jgi:hypothetical protein
MQHGFLGLLCGSAVITSVAMGDPNTTTKPATPAPKFTLLVASGGVPKEPVSISLISISPALPDKPSLVTYLDPTGAQKTAALKDLVALAPAGWVPTAESTAAVDDARTSDLTMQRLDLTDSQRLVGSFPDTPGISTGAGDAPVLFRHERLGTLAFPLDRVLRYSSSARVTPDLGGRALSASADTVLLSNTDRLEGLVTRLGPSVWIETKSGAGGAGGGAADPKAPKPPAAATQIDAEQVLLVQLVNPMRPLRAIRVDLTDGTVIGVDAISAETRLGTMAIHPIDAPARAHSASGAAEPPAATTLEIGSLAAVVPNPGRITSLSSLPIAGQTMTGAAGGRTGQASARVLSSSLAPLSAADILLPGPMSVEWAIPAGAASIIGYAQMDDQSFAWGDCTAVVTIVPKAGQERELARGRINAETPMLTIAAELGAVSPGDRLRVKTEAGDRGPIQDRVVLRRMVFLGK